MCPVRTWNASEDLVYHLVRHYKDRGAGIRYWEVGNEPDIGEDGGCPYRFTPENYLPYYQHTVAAILRADPDAKVGGPAVANYRSPIFRPSLSSAPRARRPYTLCPGTSITAILLAFAKPSITYRGC